MGDDNFTRWVWQDDAHQDIPDSVEAFWAVVRDLNYDIPVEDGDLCAVYKETRDGAEDVNEHLLVGRYNEHADAVETVISAAYGHYDVPTVLAQTQAFPYEMEQIADDGYRVAAFDSGPGWRSGHGKDPIDIHGVPDDVMEQLKEYGTYWGGDDVLAVDRWDDRLMRFHGTDNGE